MVVHLALVLTDVDSPLLLYFGAVTSGIRLRII